MEPVRKVRDRIVQPSDIATKQQHQPGSKNKHIHKKLIPCKFMVVLDGILVTTYGTEVVGAGQTSLKALKMANIRANHGGTNLEY